MKRILSFFLCVIIILSLFSCSPGIASEETEEEVLVLEKVPTLF